MDLNFCTVCYRETSGALYCGELCRLHDVAAVDEGHTLPSPGSPSEDFRSLSGSSEEEDAERDRFVLPGRRNARLGDPFAGGRLDPLGSRKLASRHPNGAPSRLISERPFGGSRRPVPLDEEDPELDYLSRLTPPIGLEHRERHRESIPEKHARQFERYVFKREFPSAF